MSFDNRTEILSFNGFSFNVVSSGPDDGAPVLLLHGFPQFADVWSGLMEQLSREGFRAVAFDQRGYSPAARPPEIESYHVDHLAADVLALADLLQEPTFHLVGHDWGGLLAWKIAAEHPGRVRSVSVLSTAHPDALFDAIANDPDQGARSKYFDFFKMPGHAAESYFLADGCERLQGVYQGKVAPEQVARNIERLSQPGALTAALNWYRALDLRDRIGSVMIPTLYLWGDKDMALGRTAAISTGSHIEAPYRFEILEGYSHWLLEEASEEVGSLILGHLRKSQASLRP